MLNTKNQSILSIKKALKFLAKYKSAKLKIFENGVFTNFSPKIPILVKTEKFSKVPKFPL